MQEQRLAALHHCLERINSEVELAAKHDVAICFPMGGPVNERVLSLCASEAVLLNSREKVCCHDVHRSLLSLVRKLHDSSLCTLCICLWGPVLYPQLLVFFLNTHKSRRALLITPWDPCIV